MARKKARQRISYVVPLANSPCGHRLGVNSLAIDSNRSILYSAGRDGVICAWDIDSSDRGSYLTVQNNGKAQSSKKTSSFRSQIQAHTHWVNDIILAQSNAALVSASSDITVKVWRPHGEDGKSASTIGVHSDYVKCLASPDSHSDWVASGGLDHKIRVWDLSGAGERLEIDTMEEGSTKGSVYALSVRGSVMASGGPDSILRLWDQKSGKRITNFVGHTDNVRDILINQSGDTIMSASSDQTVKVWSLAAGRCMHTLTMHNDSVWSLYSDHAQLALLYSADRSGMIAKTDLRGSPSMDEGLSIAVAQEHEGVNKLVVTGNTIWSATSSSSINRWKDVDTTAELQMAESPRQNRISSLVSRPKTPCEASQMDPKGATEVNAPKIPLNCILRISNAVPAKARDMDGSIVYSSAMSRKQSEVVTESDFDVVIPYHSLPFETIEGHNGLIKHVMLHDRKRVLTLDTAGEVVLWDLLKCIPIKSYGKRHLEDVTPGVNTMESVANWCAVDTRTGRLAVVLEENYCFDAEMYGDEIDAEERIDFREDQRINLGKWVLRYLFASLIDEEIRRDELYRYKLQNVHRINDQNRQALRLGQLPERNMSDWDRQPREEESLITPRPTNGLSATTPGLAIGFATPGLSAVTTATNSSSNASTSNHSTSEESAESKRPQTSNDKTSGDYFSNQPPASSQSSNDKSTDGSSDGQQDAPQSPVEPEKDGKAGSFAKKFRIFPKKLGRTSVEAAKAPIVDDKSEESDKSSEKEDKVVEDNFLGTIQKIRNEYEEILQSNPKEPLASGIVPSLPDETPVLKPPPLTTIIIQEDNPDSGGVADIYRGTVSGAGHDADLIEKKAPMWLGDLLLRNQTPFKEIVKVSFILQPYHDLLPSIAGADGNARLNANRMLRAKKIIAYVTERIDPHGLEEPNALRPEDYVDLYCHDQLVPHNMTLATIRAHVWKTGGDVMLYYKGNGRKPEMERQYAELKAEKARLALREQENAAAGEGTIGGG